MLSLKMTMPAILRILTTAALSFAAVGVMCSCQQNALTIKAGQDYFTPELQQKIQRTGWRIINCSCDNDSDRAARKTFHLKRADVHGGESRYHIYYHEKTKQIVLFAKNEIEIKAYKGGIPLYCATNSFGNTAEFPLYVVREEAEDCLRDSRTEDYRLDAIPPGWLDVFVSVHCKKFYEYEMKNFGKSVYEGVFTPNKGVNE